MSGGQEPAGDEAKPPSREEACGSPFPVEPRRDWYEMVVEDEQERRAVEAREGEAEEMRQRAVEAAARRIEGRVRAEEASALIRAAAVRDRERG